MKATAAAAIQQFAGHIAQYFEDGLLVYFGYPQAHEIALRLQALGAQL